MDPGFIGNSIGISDGNNIDIHITVFTIYTGNISWRNLALFYNKEGLFHQEASLPQNQNKDNCCPVLGCW